MANVIYITRNIVPYRTISFRKVTNHSEVIKTIHNKIHKVIKQ